MKTSKWTWWSFCQLRASSVRRQSPGRQHPHTSSSCCNNQHMICAMHAHVNIWHAYVHVGWPCTHFRLYTSRICLDGHVMCLRSFHLTSFDVPTYVISCDVTYFSSLCLSRYFSLWMMNYMYISLQVDWQIKWYEWHATPRKLNFRLWKCTDTSCDNITLWCM